MRNALVDCTAELWETVGGCSQIWNELGVECLEVERKIRKGMSFGYIGNKCAETRRQWEVLPKAIQALGPSVGVAASW